MEQFKPEETIKPVGVPSGNPSAGIGYIIVPIDKDVDRNQYVEDCYRSQTVSMQGGKYSGVFHNVAIDREVIKNIQFPKEKGQTGTPVVWVNIMPFNKPVIIASLQYETDYYLNDEGEWNVSREFDGNHIDMSWKTKKNTIDISIHSEVGTPGKFNINVINPDKTSEFNVYVKGRIKLHASEDMSIISDKKITLHVMDENSEDKMLLMYEANKGLSYIDEFENEITIKDKEVRIKSDKIILENADAYTLKTLLEDIITEISNITTATSIGPQAPINKAAIIALKQKVEKILK